jgi:hypothetical protein
MSLGMCIQSIQLDSTNKSKGLSINGNSLKSDSNKNKKTPLLDNAQLDQIDSDHEWFCSLFYLIFYWRKLKQFILQSLFVFLFNSFFK